MSSSEAFQAPQSCDQLTCGCAHRQLTPGSYAQLLPAMSHNPGLGLRLLTLTTAAGVAEAGVTHPWWSGGMMGSLHHVYGWCASACETGQVHARADPTTSRHVLHTGHMVMGTSLTCTPHCDTAVPPMPSKALCCCWQRPSSGALSM